MTENQVIGRLSFLVNEAGGQRAWAKAHGFSAAYVNDVLMKRRAPAEKICAAMGIQRKVVYQVSYARKS